MWNLYDVGKVCQESSTANFVQFVGLHDKKVKVATYDWTNHLGKFFNKIDNIKDYQHFSFNKSEPGIVSCLRNLGDEPRKFNILKRAVDEIWNEQLPPIIEPVGFTLERQQYLFREIRPFCHSESRDLVAPHPPY